MTKGKLVLVPFPFDDLSGTKVRPAVCLTNPIGSHRHVVLAFVTSQVPQDRLETDVVLDAGLPGFGTTGLKVTSTLRLHRLMTATTSLVRRELGELPESARSEVGVKPRHLFDLA